MIKKFVNIIALIGVLAVNYLANALPINGKNTGELSDQYPNLFVPAGITFSIWGLIYLLLIVWVIAQFISKEARRVDLGWLFALSCVLNVSWIFLWHYEQLVIAMIIMWWLLRTLVVINQRLPSGSDGLARATFGIYLGWICIATIANVTAVLVSINWNGFGLSEVMWTIVLIAAGTGIAIWLIRTLNNSFLAFSVAWAFAGIILKRQGDFPAIAYAAGAGVILVVALVIFRTFRHQRPGVDLS